VTTASFVTVETLPERSPTPITRCALMSDRHEYLRDGTAIYEALFRHHPCPRLICRCFPQRSRLSRGARFIPLIPVRLSTFRFGGGLSRPRVGICAPVRLSVRFRMVAHGVTRRGCRPSNDFACTLARSARSPLASTQKSQNSAPRGRPGGPLELWDRATRPARGRPSARADRAVSSSSAFEMLAKGAPSLRPILGIPGGLLAAPLSNEAWRRFHYRVPLYLSFAAGLAAAP